MQLCVCVGTGRRANFRFVCGVVLVWPSRWRVNLHISLFACLPVVVVVVVAADAIGIETAETTIQARERAKVPIASDMTKFNSLVWQRELDDHHDHHHHDDEEEEDSSLEQQIDCQLRGSQVSPEKRCLRAFDCRVSSLICCSRRRCASCATRASSPRAMETGKANVYLCWSHLFLEKVYPRISHQSLGDRELAGRSAD